MAAVSGSKEDVAINPGRATGKSALDRLSGTSYQKENSPQRGRMPKEQVSVSPANPAPAPSQEGVCPSDDWLLGHSQLSIITLCILAGSGYVVSGIESTHKNHVSWRLRETERLELTLKWDSSTDRQPSERAIEISFCVGTMASLGEAGNGGSKERILALIFF